MASASLTLINSIILLLFLELTVEIRACVLLILNLFKYIFVNVWSKNQMILIGLDNKRRHCLRSHNFVVFDHSTVRSIVMVNVFLIGDYDMAMLYLLASYWTFSGQVGWWSSKEFRMMFDAASWYSSMALVREDIMHV